MKSSKMYLSVWAVLLLAYPIGCGVGAALTERQDPAGAAFGSALGTLFGIGLAVVAAVVISIGSGEHISRSRAGRTSLRVVPWLIVALVSRVSFFPPWNGDQLRTDLSATITYVGEYEEIVLDCTDMYGSFGNRRTKRNEVVEIDSVRDDGRIVVAWGPDYSSRQDADLLVGPSVPEGGHPVVVAITLSDTEATYVVQRK